MSEIPEIPGAQAAGIGRRCPHCDSVIPAGGQVCLMCGRTVPLEPAVAAEPLPAPAAVTEAEATSPAPGAGASSVLTSVVREQRSPILMLMTAVVFVITAVAGVLVVRYGGPVQLALVATATPIPPTASFTPSATLPPTATIPPTPTPSLTPLPSPTATPRSPRVHEVAGGETLFGLSLFYNVSMESIAEQNGFSVESPIQSGQTLQIPWPTATPPLQPIAIEVNGETVIADPSDCERYEIQDGDAISVIAARYNLNMQLLQQVNRLNDRTILKPGDTICIPRVVYGEVLPPTPGPSPTPSPTSFPSGPTLLYPTDGTVVESVQQPVVLQWVAVKDLGPDEWYMVELTDLTLPEQHPRRGFTRQNSFHVPGTWRPTEVAYHEFRWRVSIVKVTGRRQDGGFIYTFGGRNSEDAYFTWLGAIPTPTPTPTPTATPEA